MSYICSTPTTWTYDPLGRLTAVTHPDGGKVETTYDLFGRRQTATTHIHAGDLTGNVPDAQC